MTVIVGLETTVGEKAVVLGADRLAVNGDLLVAECIRNIAEDSTYSLESCFEFLKEKGFDKVKLKSGRKIQFSEENNSVLMQTGPSNKANEQIEMLLLNPKEFLKDNPLLIELSFPLGVPKNLLKEYLRLHKEYFKLDSGIKLGVIPEVKRIFDIHTAKRRDFEFEHFKIAYWDRNYHPVLSEYLFAKLFYNKPKLFDIALTGAITPRQYYAKGCGAQYALEHMRDRLGTRSFNFLYPSETKIKKDIDLEEAIRTVKGAVEYASYCSDFCKGFDYIILKKSGIETHFSDEEFSHEINLIKLIERRMKTLGTEIEQLKRIKSECTRKELNS